MYLSFLDLQLQLGELQHHLSDLTRVFSFNLQLDHSKNKINNLFNFKTKTNKVKISPILSTKGHLNTSTITNTNMTMILTINHLNKLLPLISDPNNLLQGLMISPRSNNPPGEQPHPLCKDPRHPLLQPAGPPHPHLQLGDPNRLPNRPQEDPRHLPHNPRLRG